MKKYITLLIFLTSLVFITVITGTAQTPDELKQKYGSPDSKGIYIVRPNIGLLVKYKDNRNITEMLIKPFDSYSLMNSDEAEKVLDEVFPVAKRGKKGNSVDVVSGCLIDITTLYKLFSISIAKRCGTQAQGGGTYSISIRWTKYFRM